MVLAAYDLKEDRLQAVGVAGAAVAVSALWFLWALAERQLEGKADQARSRNDAAQPVGKAQGAHAATLPWLVVLGLLAALAVVALTEAAMPCNAP